MLTGRTPAATGVRVNSQPLAAGAARKFPLVTELLRSAGWRTGAFVSAETLASKYGLGAGFEEYDDKGLGGSPGGLNVPERDGDDTLDAALSWLDARVDADDSVFLFVHLFEPHYPYKPTYRADCEDADRLIGELLKGLEKRGRGNAAIILTADHGEALGELGEKTHGVLLSDGSMRVPLIIRVPGQSAGVRTDPVCIPDIAPTIADLAGVAFDEAEGDWSGRSLLGAPLPADRIRVAESLYGHHRYRWAQLAGTVLPSGQLVDAGTDRAHWLPVQPHGEDLVATQDGAKAPSLAALADALSSYKSSEESDLMAHAYGITGYGAGGEVTGFLQGPENANLPDPHRMVGNADLLHEIAAAAARAGRWRFLNPKGEPELVSKGDLSDGLIRLKRLIKRLEAMAGVDGRNPEVHFRLARTNQKAGVVSEQLGQLVVRKRYFARAEAAFAKAWQAGRRDEGALLGWCGVNAGGREAAMLERLEANAKAVGAWTCQMYILKATLLRQQIQVLQEAGKPVPEALLRAFKGTHELGMGVCKTQRHRQMLERLPQGVERLLVGLTSPDDAPK